MSIPPLNYTIPPPSLNVPPPVSSPVVPVVSPVPPPQYYNHLPPYEANISQNVQHYLNMPSGLPPLNVPPPVPYGPSTEVSVSFPVPTNPSSYSYRQPGYGSHDRSAYSKYKTETIVRSSNDYDSAERQSGSSKDLSKDVPTSSRSRYSRHESSYERERCYERDRKRDRDHSSERRKDREYKEAKYREHRRSRSPSRYYDRYRDRERYIDRERDRRHDYKRSHSPYHRDYRSHSRSIDSRDSRRDRRSPSRHSERSSRRESHSHSRARERSPSYYRESIPKRPLTDREKILEDYRKNYCETSGEFIRKMEQWSREHHSDEEETSKMWYRSSPAELYYKPTPDGVGVMQTSKLEKRCSTFFKELIERGRKARPEVDELPPLRPSRGKACKHRMDDKSSSSSDSDECMDEDGLQGYSDRIMMELQRKQSHPRRLHPEMWFNNTGEMNGGPLCRCSARARRYGMRHGVYAGEEAYPKCIPTESNIDKLYHYRITVSPPTNFLIKAPTIIAHDEHEFLFSGFSMFSHYKLSKLPTCKVIRFNIEYTILYVEEPAPQNFSIQELDLFEEYLFYELLELVDLDLGKATETTCSQFHFMPRFVRYLPEGGCEVLSMCEVLKYLIDESGLLIPPDTLEEVHSMDHYKWQKFVDRIKGMIVTYPGKKPCSVRVDQLDRSPPVSKEMKDPSAIKKFYPEIVHFGIRPPQLSYAGNPEYQKAWRYYVKYRHLIANMAKPSYKERQKLATKEAKLQEMRTQTKMKRDVTVAISSEGFHTTGLMCDVVQHAMLIPVLVRHLRFHKSLDSLEKKIGYVFKKRLLLQTAFTHPSYRENFGTNPDHARNSLTNCGIRQPEYGDRRIHYTRKKGIVTLINIMSRFGKRSETESEIKHNERLEFLGDAVVEFLSSIHLFRMFPGLAEGGLATYRASIVQNQHLAQLAKNIELEQYMLYAHGSDLCRELVMRHAMANYRRGT
ncbi:Ribonuclease 3 [Papilio xuthus]|uniref:Ribonuclease 3 n=1 Tax=Papilio xuthus TaxID=66420 RepID=A0A194PGX9_PAPXU|nr:Ribonuclease 3 [Papilio xuthus]